MATLTINIPNALVPTLTSVADEKLDAMKIDRTAMTTIQRAQRYVAEVLKDIYISRTRSIAQASAQGPVDTAVSAAITDAAGIN